MHPILSRGERLAAYLAVWLVIGILLAAVLTGQGLEWPEALALLLPLCLVYSFVCLSAWYVCRATPLRTSGLSRVLATSGLAALVSGALWLGLARAWIAALSELSVFATRADVFLDQAPFLFASGVLLFLLALAVHHALIAFETVTEAERRQLELEVLAREAELRALRAQVDPHFLYNSLNSISALTKSDPDGARRMCILLGEFLRETLRVSGRARIPLSEELALAERFLGIEQVRFGARLRIEQHVDAAASLCRVPPLVLQPLVENAITHGIAGLLEGGVIHLDITRLNGRLAVALENPRDVDSPAPTGRGVGLDSVRRRLTTMFGSTATMRTEIETGRFRVELDLPCSVDD
jgi:two-component system sensor histidine kinase AlgZ